MPFKDFKLGLSRILEVEPNEINFIGITEEQLNKTLFAAIPLINYKYILEFALNQKIP
jgi:hypothetical protein